LRTATIARAAGRGLPALPFQRHRRDIFVEPPPKQNSSPVGAAYSDNAAPERSLGEIGLRSYKDFAPTALAEDKLWLGAFKKAGERGVSALNSAPNHG